MKRKFLIIKHVSRGGPGILETIIKEQQVPYDVVDLDVGDNIPVFESYSALIVLGGLDSVNDEIEKMQDEIQKVREWLTTGKPYLGICLGMQVLVKAAEGQVVKSPIKEVGFRDPEGKLFEVQLTKDWRNDLLFRKLKDTFKVFLHHRETVELNEAVKLLGVGKFCRNQIVKVGQNAYGIQSHPELTPEMFDVWVNEDPDLLRLDKGDLIKDFEDLKNDYVGTGRQILENFVSIVGVAR